MGLLESCVVLYVIFKECTTGLHAIHMLKVRLDKGMQTTECVHVFGGPKAPHWGVMIQEDSKMTNFQSPQNAEKLFSN